MRLPLLLAVLLGAAAAADDSVLTKYELVPTDIHDALFIDVTSGDFWTPPPTSSLKALDVPARVAVVKAFAQYAKAYTASSDFASRYSKWRTHELGEAPKKPPTYEQWVKEQKQAMSAANDQAKQQLDSLPPDQQAQVKQLQSQMDAMTASMTPEQKAQLQQMMQQMGGVAPDGSAAATGSPKNDKELYQQLVVDKYKQDQAAYQERLARCPEKPSAAVKAALQKLLAATADVNFDAKITEVSGHRIFSDDANEAKPAVWKQAFRAGKEATAAARQAAQSWVAELK
jgi:hypothetical protein